MEELLKIKVIVFGLGGVGSWCVEALVRTGVDKCTIVDPDMVSLDNLNRQVQANSSTIGMPKAEALAGRLREIRPTARIDAVRGMFSADTADRFGLSSYDYVIDAIDRLQDKALLIERCVAQGVEIFSSMGAARRMDPTRVRTGRIRNTSHCPLARRLRRLLRERPAALDVICVYSDEPPASSAAPCGSGEYEDTPSAEDCTRINGSLVQVTAVFGLMLAGLVIRDTVARCASEGGGIRPI